MTNASQEYLTLFNGISDTISLLEKEITRLRMLQMRAEELFLESEEEDEASNLIAL